MGARFVVAFDGISTPQDQRFSGSGIFDDSGSFVLHDRLWPSKSEEPYGYLHYGFLNRVLHLSLGVFRF